jgi:hypothetical protein
MTRNHYDTFCMSHIEYSTALYIFFLTVAGFGCARNSLFLEVAENTDQLHPTLLIVYTLMFPLSSPVLLIFATA